MIVIVASMVIACAKKEALITVPEGAQAGDLTPMEPCTYEAGGVGLVRKCTSLLIWNASKEETEGKPTAELKKVLIVEKSINA